MALLNGKQILNASIAGGKLINATITATQVDTSSIATVSYVDTAVAAMANGLDWKGSVDLATVAALPACTAAGAKVGKTLTADAVGVLTVDGVATVLNDILLVKNQAEPMDNGIYKVTTEGTAGVAFVLTRVTYADQNVEVTTGLLCTVERGTLARDAYILNDFATTDLDVDYDLVFSEFPLFPSVDYATTAELVNVDAAAESAGTSATTARGDHKHALSVGSPVAVGSANADGTSTSAARADHVHDSPVPTTSNKNMTANVTTADGQSAINTTTVAAANALGGYVGVRINGVAVVVGTATTGSDCYFSGDGGTTARAFAAIAAGDTLHWNGSVAGYELAATDRIDLDMDTF